MTAPTPSATILAALGLDDARLKLFPTGLINTTWLAILPNGEERVLQRANPLFPREVTNDIQVVTEYLAANGVATPRLVPATDGRAIVLDDDGIVWRQTTHIPGVTYDALTNDKQSEEAGALLGRFHRIVSDIDHDFSMARLGVHDTAKHLKNLLTALLEQADHARFASIEPLTHEVLELTGDISKADDHPDRVVHGDPKISNVVFDPDTDGAICLIDFDTMGRMPVVLELGDAFRSWCNPHSEDADGAEFSLPLFEAAIAGYARETRDFLTELEWRGVPGAIYTITVELAARFCADALNESYFAWDDSRFASASAHNEARTRNQLALARSIADQRSEVEALVERVFRAVGSGP